MKKAKILILLSIALLSLSGCDSIANPSNSNTSNNNTTSNVAHVHDLEYFVDGNYHYAKCKTCDYTSEKELHIGGISTCTTKAKCDLCKAEYGDFDDHDLSEWVNVDASTHKRTCSNCSYSETLNHVFSKEIIDDSCLVGTKTSACEESNTYFKSCICGAHSTNENSTFTVPNLHSFTLEKVLDDNSNLSSLVTCEDAARYYKVCEYCETAYDIDHSFEVGEPLGHDPIHKDELLSFSQYTLEHYECSHCGAFFLKENNTYNKVAKEDITFLKNAQCNNLDLYGSEEHPFIITSAADLKAIASKINNDATHDKFASCYYELANDIELNGDEDFVIGNHDNRPFSGVLDGKNHTISNFTKESENAAALFSRVTNGTIKNLKMHNATVTVTTQRASCLVARGDNATILNCEVSGDIAGAKEIGGIVATVVNNTSTIKNCKVNITASADGTNDSSLTYNAIGGIVGYIHSGNVEIDNCEVSGTISGALNGIGGILGYASNGAPTIKGCKVSAIITGKNLGIGGILGYASSLSFLVTECEVSATIKSTIASKVGTGGIVGYIEKNSVESDFQITKCLTTNTANIHSASEGAGGILGYKKYGNITISECINNANVKGVGNGTGGVLGAVLANSNFTNVITKCENYGTVEGSSYVGGIVGLLRKGKNGSIVKECYNFGNVTSTGTTVGGIAGVGRFPIEDCYVYSEAIITSSAGAKLAKELAGNKYITSSLSTKDSDGIGSITNYGLVNLDKTPYAAA